MLEFLQPLVDLIAKTVPALSKRHERDEAARLGAELFLLYVQCNEALVQGEHIVRSLESYLALVAQGSQWADDVRTSLSRGLRDQLRTMTAVAARLREFQFAFHVLEGPAYLELRFHTDLKMAALYHVVAALDEDRLPLRTAGLLIDNGGVLQPGPGPGTEALRRLNYQLSDEIAASSLPLDRPWGPEMPAVVERYLAVRRPREQLERIRSALEKIRAALVANFSLGDVLLRAGDPRAHRGR
ncbi:hypothetical protein [Kutzneria sp. 744]|uniref:hypothetical protein n=1 Tax=Kutzneria sp. (strain 744) TaxID=345341 RepID=UPI0003EED8DC|nr:hypothetical protein [Kutzneria sp. 744]EWM14470.1 mucin-7 [Kutzneria sp. 744]